MATKMFAVSQKRINIFALLRKTSNQSQFAGFALQEIKHYLIFIIFSDFYCTK